MNLYDCIIFVAHPDDAFLGMGGTLYKLSLFSNVLLVCASNGENGNNLQGKDRLEELNKSSKLFSIDFISLELTDGELIYNQQKLYLLFLDILKRNNPKYIYTHHPNDKHNDHVAVYRSCITAIDSLWHHHKTNTLLSHTFCFTPIHIDFCDLKKLDYNTFYDISDCIKQKEEALKYHISQMPYIEKNMSKHLALSKFLGVLCGCEFVEAFYECRSENVKSLDSLLGKDDMLETIRKELDCSSL
ncbi:PIG-L deacetylase family protein [uncultured Ruminococcus sp.]|uniref:PIG-L deacetylase family protein n=1 Tax=uncultured Ruminococcus sp. TaxID=165186 RepID=UPI0025F62098|nr:PIG-L family deacetylase [uncultured Ruminococcus sp.]